MMIFKVLSDPTHSMSLHEMVGLGPPEEQEFELSVLDLICIL